MEKKKRIIKNFTWEWLEDFFRRVSTARTRSEALPLYPQI